jgi:hydroxypyruvate isomerase
MPFEDRCREAARLGCVGFDLVGPKDWPTLKKYGLIPTMAPPGGVTFEDGIIHKEAHEKFLVSLAPPSMSAPPPGAPTLLWSAASAVGCRTRRAPTTRSRF